MYCLKCKKTNNDNWFYIWANENDINEWCISKNPCNFKNHDTVFELFSKLNDKPINIRELIIEKI